MGNAQRQTVEPPGSPWQFGLSDRLAKALSVAGVTNGEMADYLGISANTIGNYTSGRTAPKKQTLRLWAMRTGAPLLWLETGDMTDGRVNDLKHSASGHVNGHIAPVIPIFINTKLTTLPQASVEVQAPCAT